MNFEQAEKLKKIIRQRGAAVVEILAETAFEIVAVLSVESLSEKPTRNEPAQMPKLLKKKEIAEFLQVSVRQINDRMNEGLPFHGSGRNVRFDREEVLAWTKNRKPKIRQRKNLRVIK